MPEARRLWGTRDGPRPRRLGKEKEGKHRPGQSPRHTPGGSDQPSLVPTVAVRPIRLTVGAVSSVARRRRCSPSKNGAAPRPDCRRPGARLGAHRAGPRRGNPPDPNAIAPDIAHAQILRRPAKQKLRTSLPVDYTQCSRTGVFGKIVYVGNPRFPPPAPAPTGLERGPQPA